MTKENMIVLALSGVLLYCTPPGKFFSLGGDLEPEELESELYVILDSLFAEGNQINF